MELSQIVMEETNVGVVQNEHITHLRRALSSLLERQSDVTLSSFERNKIKKTILALRAGIEALQVQVHA